MSLFPSFVAGLVLGLWHFGSLQWVCHRFIVNSRSIQRTVVPWQVLRIVVMSVALAILALEGVAILAVSMLGVLLSRTVLIGAGSPAWQRLKR